MADEQATPAWEVGPDIVEWVDPQTGYRCRAERHPRMRHWCGYVQIPEHHPWHGKSYNDCISPGCTNDREETTCWDEDPPHHIDALVEVHGGVTWGGHYPGVDEVPGWWLGFDCAHFMDLVPGINGPEGLLPRTPFSEHLTYRDIGYAREQTASLAAQIRRYDARPLEGADDAAC